MNPSKVEGIVALSKTNTKIPSVSAVADLNPKQLRFFLNYIKTGEVINSYIKIYRIKNRYSAAVLGHRLLKKFKNIKQLLFEANGLGEKDIVTALKDAIVADKIVINKWGLPQSIGPDHLIRLKAVEIRNKSLETEQSPINNNNLNVVIVNDKEKNIFSMGDG